MMRHTFSFGGTLKLRVKADSVFVLYQLHLLLRGLGHSSATSHVARSRFCLCFEDGKLQGQSREVLLCFP